MRRRLTYTSACAVTVPACYYTMTLNLRPFDPKLWSIHLCPILHCWCKFGENVSNTLQDITLC